MSLSDCRVAAYAAAAVFASVVCAAPAQAGLVTIVDLTDRRVEALAFAPSDPENPGETVDERIRELDGTGPFAVTVEARLGTIRGSANTSATIDSLISEAGFDMSGVAQLASSGEGNSFATFILRSRFLLSESQRYDFTGDVFTAADPSGSPTASVKVEFGGTSPGFNIDTEIGPTDADGVQFARSGLLGPGEYTVSYEVMFNAGGADGTLGGTAGMSFLRNRRRAAL